ncbi:glyoxylate/hydroxypyruvate reductase GhrA [Edwardsiella tarda]|uniref:Glyoxylate/hydroxypyruvate reductase GhrA n=3 Tax=Edwardsiella tarda TaxID=636 RepID=A0A2A7U7N4_EDWTA|nr:glyoxylate/hydroxypyruvate reductase GhrA [Edwardsiella tarda]AKH89413.1 glyoxylate/hydroxypyruvate reductase GhrA [Edwardsiella tarda]ATI63051.1 glyoxylate/hydroxypyruvate reductase GhrA [Edwardsiella tarda]EFE23423.1 4-phosphoerythronate dehydrogenase [Edwardsiella tarda ATCC 23685]PEH74271.1 glyoxylate/hydroxypyruvate reductase GhrA [Edwardsiella tarda]UAL54910.1 glyoxylate/hydroxypyruvate reductase GhrA [Edwardsiella tarda]
MEIIYYHPFFDAQAWLDGMRQRLPQARIRQWLPGDNAPADYALVWQPPYEMLAERQDLRAIFALGAGVDAILSQAREHPGMLPAGIPLVRLEDTGMAQQMEEYAVAAVMRYFRRFDEYAQQQRQGIWRYLAPHEAETFTIGVLGAGVLGGRVARRLASFGLPVRCWSRGVKDYPQVQSFYGNDQLAPFLHGVQLLINLLPNTPQTVGILNASLFAQLNAGAYVINLARGVHLDEDALLAALDSGQVAAATLDVFAREPLPGDHPFWQHPRVTLTPHIAAITLAPVAMDYIADNIRAIEAGRHPEGVVDIARGY